MPWQCMFSLLYDNKFRFGYQNYFLANILYSLSLIKALDAFS
jgi:hypothetical protein